MRQVEGLIFVFMQILLHWVQRGVLLSQHRAAKDCLSHNTHWFFQSWLTQETHTWCFLDSCRCHSLACFHFIGFIHYFFVYPCLLFIMLRSVYARSGFDTVIFILWWDSSPRYVFFFLFGECISGAFPRTDLYESAHFDGLMHDLITSHINPHTEQCIFTENL